MFFRKKKIELPKESLVGADLKKADLRNNDFSNANLTGANLSFADLSNADLSGADLTGANLTGAVLKEANLKEANLRGATLIDDKVDKETGKGLSSEDFTAEDKAKLDSLENYDDTALVSRISANEDAIDVLNGDSTVVGSVDSKVASCLADSKSYTDTSVQNAIRQTAIVCDAKPTISGDIITYQKDGNTYNVASDNKTKFYYTTSGINYSTIWIDGTEFTDTLDSVNFSDYVSKTNDVVSSYTGDEVDKTKIPDLGALDDLKDIVDDELAEKVNIDDIESVVSSSSDNPVASSTLYTEFAKKVDIQQGTTDEKKPYEDMADDNAGGEDGTSIFYGTMDEWDTLTTDEKKPYDYMADDNAGGNYTDTYSTTETLTNKLWIDGKPIYRKVFYSATNWANNATIGNVPDLDYCVSLHSIVVATNNYTYTDFGSDNNNVYGDAQIMTSGTNKGNIQVRRSGIMASSNPSNVIVEYTKTTD